MYVTDFFQCCSVLSSRGRALKSFSFPNQTIFYDKCWLGLAKVGWKGADR